MRIRCVATSDGGRLPSWHTAILGAVLLGLVSALASGVAGADVYPPVGAGAHVAASTWRVPSGVGPPQVEQSEAFRYGLSHPNVSPPGANDWSCVPRPGTDPVVLVHGTWSNAYSGWARIAPLIRHTRRCVFALNYGITSVLQGGAGAAIPGRFGTGDITESASELAQFVARVRAATHSRTVSLVGHSQGGVVARYYLRYRGGGNKVSHLITLGSPNNGTTLSGIAGLGYALAGPAVPFIGPAAAQQVYDSPIIKQLNRNRRYTFGAVRYTIVGTRYDQVATPYAASTFFPPGSPRTKNIVLQDLCPADHADHTHLPYSPTVGSVVLAALADTPPTPCRSA